MQEKKTKEFETNWEHNIDKKKREKENLLFESNKNRKKK